MTTPSTGQLMRISDLAKRCGLTRQTVQYYLLLGLIKETRRSDGGQRLFDPAVIQRVKLIHKLNESGYALRDIRETFLKKK
jgi:MerR family transcriptional regulator, mercuric resistance operon regulatory protein